MKEAISPQHFSKVYVLILPVYWSIFNRAHAVSTSKHYIFLFQSTIQDLFNVDVSENDASRRMAEVVDRDSQVCIHLFLRTLFR